MEDEYDEDECDEDGIPYHIKYCELLWIEIFRVCDGIESVLRLEIDELDGLIFDDIDQFLESQFPGWELSNLEGNDS